MNLERIETSIDCGAMAEGKIVLVGSAIALLVNLARCGLGAITHIDPDCVSASNPARQDFDRRDVGQLKIDVARRRVRAINPRIAFTGLARDFCSLNQQELDDLCAGAHLIIAATDFFPAQARCNVVARERGIPLLTIGVYAGGRGGEIIHGCLRCAAPGRYAAFEEGAPPVSSQGGTILDLHLVDAIAGQIAVGLLTRGADNRFGRLVEALGDRRLLLVKIDPELRFGERDLFKERLGDDPASFSFTTIALRYPDDPACPDCARAKTGAIA